MKERLEQIANDPNRPENERLGARRAVNPSTDRNDELARLEAALLAHAGAPSLNRVGDDDCFEFCAALGWSQQALSLWHRQQEATAEARARYLIGPFHGDPPSD